MLSSLKFARCDERAGGGEEALSIFRGMNGRWGARGDIFGDAAARRRADARERGRIATGLMG